MSILSFIIPFMAFLVALSVHESAHAWIAFKLGDPTAKSLGRISMNPLRHLDPLGTLMMFIAHIGWGKPVPVDPRNFTHPIRDNAITSLAGPASNLLTAILATIPYRIFLAPQTELGMIALVFFDALITINVFLCLFNLIPIAPFDGAAILEYFIPRNMYHRYIEWVDRNSGNLMVALIVDMFLLPELFGFSILRTLIFIPADFLIDFIKIGA